MSEPIHGLSPADLRRWSDLSPTGLPCREHSSTVVEQVCYWHTKRQHLEGRHVSLEARRWIGFDEPQPEPRWNTDRGWRSAEDALRVVSREDERDEERYRGIRWLVQLGTTTAELSV